MNPFLRAQKKPWSAFRAFRFSLFARAQANAHVHFERERERAENEKSKKKTSFPNEREVARADSAQVPRPFTRQSRSLTFKSNLKINRSIDKIETVSYRNASLGLLLRRRRRRLLLLPPLLLSLQPARSRTLIDTYLPKSIKNQKSTVKK